MKTVSHSCGVKSSNEWKINSITQANRTLNINKTVSIRYFCLLFSYESVATYVRTTYKMYCLVTAFNIQNGLRD